MLPDARGIFRDLHTFWTRVFRREMWLCDLSAVKYAAIRNSTFRTSSQCLVWYQSWSVAKVLVNGADVTNNATRVVASRMNLFANVDPDESKRSNWAIGEVIERLFAKSSKYSRAWDRKVEFIPRLISRKTHRPKFRASHDFLNLYTRRIVEMVTYEQADFVNDWIYY